MDLTTWMVKNHVVDSMIANELGIDRPYVNKIRNGAVHPSLGTALKIWDYTKREIAIEQLLPKHMRPKIKRPLPARKPGRPQKPAAAKASKSPVAA